jgi:hypothetical protein
MYDSATIEMTDFTIRVTGIPHHSKYDQSDETLRAMLTMHFQEIVKDELKFIKERGINKA